MRWTVEISGKYTAELVASSSLTFPRGEVLLWKPAPDGEDALGLSELPMAPQTGWLAGWIAGPLTGELFESL